MWKVIGDLFFFLLECILFNLLGFFVLFFFLISFFSVVLCIREFVNLIFLLLKLLFYIKFFEEGFLFWFWKGFVLMSGFLCVLKIGVVYMFLFVMGVVFVMGLLLVRLWFMFIVLRECLFVGIEVSRLLFFFRVFLDCLLWLILVVSCIGFVIISLIKFCLLLEFFILV